MGILDDLQGGAHAEIVARLADLQHAALCNTKHGLSDYGKHKLAEQVAKKCNEADNSNSIAHYKNLAAAALNGPVEEYVHAELRRCATCTVPVWATLGNGHLRCWLCGGCTANESHQASDKHLQRVTAASVYASDPCREMPDAVRAALATPAQSPALPSVEDTKENDEPTEEAREWGRVDITGPVKADVHADCFHRGILLDTPEEFLQSLENDAEWLEKPSWWY